MLGGPPAGPPPPAFGKAGPPPSGYDPVPPPGAPYDYQPPAPAPAAYTPAPSAYSAGQSSSRAATETYSSRTTTTTTTYGREPAVPKPSEGDEVIMQKVHQTVLELEREYKDWRTQLDKKTAELRCERERCLD